MKSHRWRNACASIAAFAMLTAVLPAARAAGVPPDPLARAIFKELIEIDTTASSGDTTLAARAMALRLRAGGFADKDIALIEGAHPKRGNLVVRLRGSGAHRPVLIIGHLDVVEARRDDWSFDPFVFTEKDGYFYGRGTQDMKDADAIAVATLIRLRQEGFVPDRDIILALTADEEGGNDNGVALLLKAHRDLIDAEFVINGDAGGIDSDAGVPLTFNLEATEKLYADFELLATDPGGHSSLPRPGNPLYRLADALGRLERSPFPVELNPVTRDWLTYMAGVETGSRVADIGAVLRTPPDPEAAGRLAQDPHYNAILRTTCVATRMQAGHANNALPQRAAAVVNCRILPGHSPEAVRQDLVRIIADPDLAVRWMDVAGGAPRDRAPDTRAMTPPPPRSDLMRALQQTVGAMWPGIPIVPELEPGASDSIQTMIAGMPSYGFFGTAIDRDDVRAHGRDERLRVRSFDEGMAFYYQFLKALTTAQP
jgi:acetylornithine deacetylase/succinyl-diaminopimelate desuccinylase-like protein